MSTQNPLAGTEGYEHTDKFHTKKWWKDQFWSKVDRISEVEKQAKLQLQLDSDYISRLENKVARLELALFEANKKPAFIPSQGTAEEAEGLLKAAVTKKPRTRKLTKQQTDTLAKVGVKPEDLL